MVSRIVASHSIITLNALVCFPQESAVPPTIGIRYQVFLFLRKQSSQIINERSIPGSTRSLDGSAAHAHYNHQGSEGGIWVHVACFTSKSNRRSNV